MKIITGIILSLFSTITFSASYVAATVSDGLAGTRSAIQLWNPTQNRYCVSAVTFTSVTSGPSLSGADLRLNTVAVGNFLHNGYSKYDYTGSGIQVRIANLIPSQIGGSVLYEMWTGQNANDHTYHFKPFLSIPPGRGILLTNAFDGEYTVGSFQFEDC